MFESKARRFDEISDKLDGILFKARQEAKAVTMTAQAQAEEQQQEITAAREKAGAQVFRLRAQAGDMRGEVEKLVSEFGERIRAFEHMLSESGLDKDAPDPAKPLVHAASEINAWDEDVSLPGTDNFFRPAATAVIEDAGRRRI